MRLNPCDAASRMGASRSSRRRGKRLVGTIIKFPDEGRIVRFGRDTDESATIIILPVIRIERYADAYGEGLEPQTRPPADNGGRRRVRRR
jgi:hypothetical protein